MRVSDLSSDVCSSDLFNFDTVHYEYYRDATVALEAFKAGGYDFRLENSSKAWATAYNMPEVASGTIKKEELEHDRSAGMQGFVYNLRRPLFQDRRVRQALAYAFDFSWRSAEHTSELQSLMRISYAVFCLKNNK